MYAGAIVVQTSRPETTWISLARGTLASINPNLTIVKFQTFQQQIDARFTEERLVARLTLDSSVRWRSCSPLSACTA